MKKDEIKQKRPFAPGIQWQLMLFIGGITLFTLLLVWGIITYALEPQYNRNIRAKLDSKRRHHGADRPVGRGNFKPHLSGALSER